jgi:hypothetical protein
MTAAVLSPIKVARLSMSLGLMNLTSNGFSGKPYHLASAPQVTAPAAAVRP